MYMVKSMISLGLQKDEEWKSKSHRLVAIGLGIDNPRVNTREQLEEIVKFVQSLSEKEVRKITFEEVERHIPSIF